MATTLLSPADLVDLDSRPGSELAIVDCRYDLTDTAWGYAQYTACHVPGAVYASLSRDMAGPRTGNNGRHPVPAPEALVETFSRLGIASGTQVVVYDQDAGMYASRLWWLLRYMGHRDAAVLDGGWARWVREGRDTRSGTESRARATFEGEPNQDLLMTVEGVEATLRDPSTLLVDARSPERFEGRQEEIDRVPGHIPGALNYYYKHNVTDDGRLLPAQVLRGHFAALLGARSPEDVVMYCGSGVTACLNLLAMEHAGLPGAKLYLGSWSEWASDPARPVETGKARVITRQAGSR